MDSLGVILAMDQGKSQKEVQCAKVQNKALDSDYYYFLS